MRKNIGMILGGLLMPLGVAAVVTVTPLSENIFKVTVSPETEATQAIVFEAEPVANLTTTTDGFSTPSASVKIDEQNGVISFYDKDGNLLLQDLGSLGADASATTVTLLPSAGANFYGTGERGHSLRLNGDTLSFYNRQNYGYTEGDPRISQMGISVPWLLTDKGYGVLFDDYGKAEAVLGDTISYTGFSNRPLSYYFVKGDNMAETIENYAKLTGHQPLPPLWALGYITSKYGYHNQAETLGVVDTLKSRGYPLDGLVLDLYWYGVETDMGRLVWDPAQWPDHKAMLDSLKKQGVNTVLISQPYINKIGALDNYNLLDSLGLLTHDAAGNTHDVTTWVGEAGMFDVANPDTRQWLWERLRPLTEEGVAGWWGDLGEPEVHPTTIVHANGETAEQFHNVYGNVWSKLIYDGLRKDFPDMRPLLMMRGGTTGLQRYGVMPWTTDVSRSWGGLQPQVKLMLSSGLSGLGYMSSDIGGFAVDPANPIDSELYIRWLEMGAFTPVLRTHAQLKPEPFHYPEIEEIAKRYIKMRYEWLPYNYNLAFENALDGYPMARPLNFYGNNSGKEYAEVSDEYLWGRDVLVAPVMTQGATTRDVIFPEGVWYDFFNPAIKYQGPGAATIDAPLDKLPLFVKAGAFIPLYLEPIENVEQYDPQFITLRYYPGKDYSFYNLYEDDRKSPLSLEENKYQVEAFMAWPEEGRLVIGMGSEGSYEGMPEFKMFTMQIVDVEMPRQVSLGTQVLPEAPSPKAIRQFGWSYDSDSRMLTVRFPWNYDAQQLAVQF